MSTWRTTSLSFRSGTFTAILCSLMVMMTFGPFSVAARELPSHHRIVVGGDHNYPPYEYLDEYDNPTGFNVDITRAVARAMGLDVEIRLGPWTKIRKGLEQGEIDAIQGMFYSSKRDLTFDFSSGYTTNPYVSLVRQGAGPPPATVKELAGKRLVVQKGDIMHDFLVEKGLESQVSVVGSQEEALRELVRGKYDCALVARMTALHLIKIWEWDNLTVGKHPILSPEYCFAVANNSRALLAELNEGLKILEETGEYRRIHKKWLGIYGDTALVFETLFLYVGLAITPLLLILFTVSLWTWSLRKQVARRTADLQEEMSRRHILLDQSMDGIVVLDKHGKVFEANKRFAKMLGYSPEEVRQLHLWDWDAQWSREQLLEKLGTVDESGYFCETRHRRKDGSCYDVEISTNGAVIGGEQLVFCVCRDITQRKQAEQALRESEAKYRLLAENASDVIWTYNLVEKRYTFISPSVESMFGYTVTEALESSLEDHISKEDLEHVRKTHKTNLPKKATPLERTFFELEQFKKDGSRFWTEVSLAIIRDEEGNPVSLHGITRDIMERKEVEKENAKLQEQLMQAQKMESVGRLAGGVAHDFNNMLSVIIGHTEAIQEETDPALPQYDNLEEILNAAKRSAGITRQLLAFARQETISPQVLDLNDAVGQTLKMLQRLLGEDIELAWVPKANVWPVKMDPNQIDQILANLCVNARDAITGVGRITIETKNVFLKESSFADQPDFVPGEFALLSVSDNGNGMDKETREKIFEPFFTTKGLGQGTGLGLATVYGIVKQNSGYIKAYSEPGNGTSIRIYLPRHEKQVPGAKMEGAEEIPRGNGETILLVEDEPSILKLIDGNLNFLGYSPLPAASPAEALALAEKHPGEIRLLMTDVVMPKMNGRDLAEQLVSLHPNLKCLYMSGYPASVIAQHGILEEGIHFLQKPFLLQELAVKVRAALENVYQEKVGNLTR